MDPDKLQQLAFDLSSRSLFVTIEPVFKKTLKLTLSGSLSMETVVAFTDRLEELLQGDYTSLLIDMQQVNYVSAFGINLLVSMKKTADAHGGNMSMLNTPQPTRDTIELLGLSSYLAPPTN